MHSLYKLSRKRIVVLFVISIVLVQIFVFSITIFVNQYYSDKLLVNENEKFVELFSHTYEFSGLDNALIYASHYVHTNNIGIEILDESDEVFFISEEPIRDYKSYFVMINEKEYTISLDNTMNDILVINNSETFYINLILVSSLGVLLLYFVISRRRRNLNIIKDIRIIDSLVQSKPKSNTEFNYIEFSNIYHSYRSKNNMIELLQEKRKEGLNGLVHDLKTPITILLSHLDDYNDPESFIINREAIRKSLEDLSNTASDIVSENFMSDSKRLNLSKAIKVEIEKYSSTFKSKNISLKSIVFDNAIVKWNQRDFTRVLGNLLTNAYYYSNNDTEVRVNLAQDNSFYYIYVINSGESIKAEDINRIFDKNIRVSKDEKIEGNGLGLYITKLLVEEVEGQIKVESKNGKNTFIIQLKKELG